MDPGERPAYSTSDVRQRHVADFHRHVLRDVRLPGRDLPRPQRRIRVAKAGPEDRDNIAGFRGSCARHHAWLGENLPAGYVLRGNVGGIEQEERRVRMPAASC